MGSVRNLCLAALLAWPASLALAANPQLLAYEQGIDDPQSRSEALRLSDLSLDFDVVGALAEVTVVARFANPSPRILEGRFSFELPEGAVVSGYALDIEGQLVDGVLIDELKAQRVFNAQVRQGVDPGVASVSRSNVFSTRVYPIPREGERTIRIRFAAPVHSLRGLRFPVETQTAVGQFRVSVNSTGHVKLPQVTLPNGLDLAWQDLRYSDRASAALYGKELKGELAIAPVQPRAPALLSLHSNGERRVHIVDDALRVAKGGETGRRLRVYWDRSLSRRDQDLKKERALLARHLEKARPQSIDLVEFNSSGATVRRVTASELNTTLAGVIYRGGTSFAVLEKLDAPPADQCLVFTDGEVTVEARRDFLPGCEVLALTSARDANSGFLQRLTGGDAAAVLRIGTQADDEILARLRGSGPRVIRAFTEEGQDLAFNNLDGGEAGWSVIAGSPVTGAVILRIAGVRGQVIERRYAPVLARRPAFDAAGALWAANEAGKLAAEDGARPAFVALSRKYSVATPGMSFLVLETVQDYVDAEITPPANFPKERLKEYRELLAERAAEKRREKEERIGDLLEQWTEVLDWWKTRFDVNAKKPEPKKVSGESRARGEAGAPVPSSAPAPASALRREMAADDSLDETQEIMVTGIRASMVSSMDVRRAAMMVATKQIDVDMAEWNLDRPYLKALDGAADFERAFAAQEKEFGTLPVFYFDVAEWMRRHGREAGAEEMLLSALELPMSGAGTVTMVAERLQRYGSLDRAVLMFERVVERVDFLPQPRRSLALALAKRAAQPGSQAREDLERAVTLLNEVVMTPWEGEFDGIELIALMEANSLLPRLRAVGGREGPLDARLRALLDVDLRVVIEWNTEATDMDLWVDEPNGERAIYSNPRTAIGGRLSNDMTAGYGPEEYLLRRAARGEYQIRVNVYGTDQINPNGSTVVTARLYRNFGRPNQSEQTMELELKPGEKGEMLIGKFTVK